LALKYWFNQSVEGLPNNLTHLEIDFTTQINNLPESLTYLELNNPKIIVLKIWF
jgi:hypothetical protein